MRVPARVSVVTLGVSDVSRTVAFYRALGWEVAVSDGDDFAAFRTAGAIFAVYGYGALAADAGLAAGGGPSGFRGVSLAINVGSPGEVDDVLSRAAEAGATVSRRGEAAFWGGYTGYFTDPDGHAWEVAHNPGWPLGEDGLPTLP